MSRIKPAHSKREGRRKRILIIVENLPVPADRRVWQEALALRDHGHAVTVLCPKGRGYTRTVEMLDGIRVYRHPLPFEATGKIGFIAEYAVAPAMELLFTTIIFVRHGCDVIQICNPPDLLFLVARIFRALFGVKLVFDHHDPFPELLREKFPRHRLLHRLALRCEKLTFARADFVISTSSALARVAHLRGGVPSDRIEIVRSAPDPGIFSPAGRVRSDNGPHVIAYVGIMGSQDGVDILVETARILVREMGRRDIQFVLAGDGPELMALKARTAALGLEDYLEFRGFIDRQGVVALLREAALGVCPDPPTPFNAMLTMNKVLEYMAMGLPIVMFDLAESRAIAGAAAAIVTEPSGHALARQLVRLIDDPAERRRMAEIGPLRTASDFSWTSQREKYLKVYARLWNLGQPTETRPVVTDSVSAGQAGSA